MEDTAEQKSNQQLPAELYYQYEELQSRPFTTPGSEIPENLLHLCHSFGYDSGHKGNLELLDDRTLIFIAGNLLVLLDVDTKKQRYLRSCSGGGIGCIAVNPSKEYFAVAEKGNQPDIIVYEYPSLRPYRILKGGTERAYSCMAYNHEGSLLASVGSTPDFMLTLWIWKNEQVLLRCKAISQDVYRVSFSPYNPDSLASSGCQHIKFWKIADTFTGLKLKGHIGHFGKTTATDIEGFIELPDGKILSGSSWGNLLLWDGNTIKVEICREKGRNCHSGIMQPIVLEDGQLMTMGSDGVIRVWDFESIDFTDSNDSSRFEMEPINEMLVGHNVCLTSVVRSPLSDSNIWFAQDSKGAIWKLDLSFTHTTPDPERLFSFHAGPIMGLGVSWKSHLIATTACDRSVKVFDFLAYRELTSSHFNQGGTVISWAPSWVDHSGGLLVVGFEDGVVRLLELYNPQKLHVDAGFTPTGNAKLRLKQAFKPHNAPVTAVAYERNGKILATGSSDSTVFFFTVGENYYPIGFVHVPGPVQALEWSPPVHGENRLLILCKSGHVIEVHSPNPKAQKPTKTFHLSDLPRKSFRFRSIKSRIKRDMEIARRRAIREKKKKEREEESKQLEYEEEEEEEEEDLPPIFIPDSPSPLCCGFYSQPEHFWLSMGGYDSGYLYHCKFSKKQNQNPDQQEDEPFDFLPICNADNDPVCSVAFSSNRQLLLCGMHSGFIRVYPLQPGDHNLTSMQAYWALSLHDNEYGHLRHICCSHDDHFVLTAGDDGNIFSFSLVPPEELQKVQCSTTARVPSPRLGFEIGAIVQDIVDPAACSIETERQKLEKDRLQQEAELRVSLKRKKLVKLQEKFRELLRLNRHLPEHVRLTPMELQLDQRFIEYARRLKAQGVREVKKQKSWEVERCSMALNKLQDWFGDYLVPVVSVAAIHTDHRISTFHLPGLNEPTLEVRKGSSPGQNAEDAAAPPENKKSKVDLAKDSSKLKDAVEMHPAAATRPTDIKLADRQVERLRKAMEKAEQARAKIEKRKQEWAQLYAEKPSENYEDPEDVEAIRLAKENIGELKLKSAKDFTVPKHLRMNAEGKRVQLKALEEKIREKQTEMNGRIVALRNTKIHQLSQLCAQAQRVQDIQQHLPAHLYRPLPPLPKMLPEEIPEKKLHPTRDTLERYRILREQRSHTVEQEETPCLLEQLEKEMEGEPDEETEVMTRAVERIPSQPALHVNREEEETAAVEEGAELSELEEEMQREGEINLQQELDSLLEQIESSVGQFDTELQLLHREKLRLHPQLKLADLCSLTLYQELQLLMEFEKREETLQETLKGCIKEKNSILLKVGACIQQLEQKQEEITQLQERERTLTAAFQTTVAENPFEKFLNKVFKKKIKRVKKKEQTGQEDEEESDEYSDEDDDWDDDDDDDDYESIENGEAPVDDRVCTPGCDPALFQNTLDMREQHLDLEDLLAEKKKAAEILKKECDTLSKKEKVVKHNWKTAEGNLELLYREKQEKMNELDVVVPLCLDQIEFASNGVLASDLSPALLLDVKELKRLQGRTEQLRVEIKDHKALHRRASREHIKLMKDQKDTDSKIQVVQQHFNELMMAKFGNLVDLEALQTLSGNRKLEELKQDKVLKEAVHIREEQEWDVMVEEERQTLMEVTNRNTKLLRICTDLIERKRELESKIHASQKKMGKQLMDSQRCVTGTEIQRLQKLVDAQSQEMENLKREISLISSFGGHILPRHCP